MKEGITESDVQAFAAKLEAFAQELSPAEQAMLAEMLAAAQAGKGDVEGYAYEFYLKLETIQGKFEMQPTSIPLNYTPLVLSYWK